jgi:hypothetical protein
MEAYERACDEWFRGERVPLSAIGIEPLSLMCPLCSMSEYAELVEGPFVKDSSAVVTSVCGEILRQWITSVGAPLTVDQWMGVIGAVVHVAQGIGETIGESLMKEINGPIVIQGFLAALNDITQVRLAEDSPLAQLLPVLFAMAVDDGAPEPVTGEELGKMGLELMLQQLAEDNDAE